MKSLFVGFLVIMCAAAGHAQSKIMAEQVRGAERIVTGAPFSAEAVSESVQTFADGNKIVRTSTSRLYRDAEGRFRRDDMPKQVGLPGAIVEIPQSVLILDPVSGSKFILDPKRSTAREMRFRYTHEQERKLEIKKAERAEKAAERIAKQHERSEKARRDGKFPGGPESIEIEKKAEMKHGDRATKDGEMGPEGEPVAEKTGDKDSESEQLGIRNFEGVDAEGTRTTTTIPAGKIGNLQEIKVVYERWYSKELQLIVFAKLDDPAFGEQTYKLTNVRRAEPPITLFSPPPDYRIVGAKPGNGAGSGSGGGSGSGSGRGSGTGTGRGTGSGKGAGTGSGDNAPGQPSSADSKKPMPKLPATEKPAKP